MRILFFNTFLKYSFEKNKAIVIDELGEGLYSAIAEYILNLIVS